MNSKVHHLGQFGKALAVVGGVGGILAFLIEPKIVGFSCIFALAVFAIFYAIRVFNSDEPSGGLKVPSPRSEGEFLVRKAKRSELSDILEMNEKKFGKDDVEPFDTLTAWFKKNENIWQVATVRGKPVGYFSLIPLAHEASERYITGELRDTEISTNDILSQEDAFRNPANILILAVLGNGSYFTQHFWSIILDLALVLDTYCHKGKGVKRVFAVAAEKEGERLLNWFDFSLVGHAEGRSDKHALYLRNTAQVQSFSALVGEIRAEQKNAISGNAPKKFDAVVVKTLSFTDTFHTVSENPASDFRPTTQPSMKRYEKADGNMEILTPIGQVLRASCAGGASADIELSMSAVQWKQ